MCTFAIGNEVSRSTLMCGYAETHSTLACFDSLHQSFASQATDSASCFKIKQNKILFGHFHPEYIFIDNETNDFRGDLTDISAKMEALATNG